MTKKGVDDSHLNRSVKKLNNLVTSSIGGEKIKPTDSRTLLRRLLVLTAPFTIFSEPVTSHQADSIRKNPANMNSEDIVALKHDHFSFIGEIPHAVITVKNTLTNRSCCYVTTPKRFNYFRARLDWYKFLASLDNPLINDDIRNFGLGDFEFKFVGLIEGSKNAEMIRDFYINNFLDQGWDCYETSANYKRFVRIPLSVNIEHKLYPMLKKHGTTLSQFVYRLIEKYLEKQNVPSKKEKS